MAKEYSIGYKFKGDASGFTRTVQTMNRNVGSIKNSFSGLTASIARIGTTIAATFAMGLISKFTKGAITAAIKTADLSRQGLETAASMTRIAESIEVIKVGIGKAIIESKFWHFWTERLENTLTKVKRLFKDTDGINIKSSMSGFADTVNKSIKDLTESLLKTDITYLVAKIKEGAKESTAMAKAWEIIHKEISGGAMSGADISQYSSGTGRLSSNFVSPSTEGLRSAPNQVQIITDSLEEQMQVVNTLTGVFQNMFSNIDNGFKGMMDSLIADLQRLATELIAKAAVFGLIWALFPGLGINISGGSGFGTGLKNFMTGNIGAPKMAALGNTGQQLKVVGKLSGRDIYLSASRYGEMLGGNT